MKGKYVLLIIMLLMPMILGGCALYDAPFFEGFSAEQLVIGLITLLVTISQALFPKISILQYLKKWLPWLRDELAYWFVKILIFAMSALALWITGEIDPDVVLTLDQVLVYYGILATITEGAYQRLKNSGRAMIP